MKRTLIRLMSLAIVCVMMVYFCPPVQAFAAELPEETTNQPTQNPPETPDAPPATPSPVGYTVLHLFDGVADGALTATLQGVPGTFTAAVAVEREGFATQAFEQQAIAEDGSTVVQIHYTTIPPPPPATANYTVLHLFDGVADDALTATLQGVPGTLTAAVAVEREGFADQAFE